MSYNDKITKLTEIIPTSLINFELERTPARTPTQATSDFITNVQQGNWAEELIFTAINETSKNHIAVRYGKSDDLIAGDPGFKVFFNEFQEELDTIGKRPDLLIFKKSDFKSELGHDISKIPHDQITNYVKQAVAGLEVRSSAYLLKTYEAQTKLSFDKNLTRIYLYREQIFKTYSDLFEHPKRKKYIDILNNIDQTNVDGYNFRVPGWRASERLKELNQLLKGIQKCLKKIQKRNFLSITVKNEDIQVIYKWINEFNVPHYYFQVFFDQAYAISFEKILKTLSNPDLEEIDYYTEKNKKNQDKPTIHIHSKSGSLVADKVDEPIHKSIRRELAKGRLLFYVSFEGGKACLDIDSLKELLNITDF